jgi:hypothetical protein
MRQVARHDLLVALRLIYQTFSKLLSWIVLRTRSDSTKEIEILVVSVFRAPTGLRAASAKSAGREGPDQRP